MTNHWSRLLIKLEPFTTRATLLGENVEATYPSHLIRQSKINFSSDGWSLPHENLSSISTPRPMATKSGPEDAPSKTAALDTPLHTLGFEIDAVSAAEVTGRLKVTELCCQPFKVLHGGVSALIAEALGSIGAHVASGFRRVAGIQLSINHHRSAPIGDHVYARASPVHVGRTTQVWEVNLWRTDPSTSERGPLLASSRVTLLTNLPVPESAKTAEETLKKYAKL